MTPGGPGQVDPILPAGRMVDRIDLDELIDVELDPAALVRLVLSCPAVAAMHGGFTGEAATYLPGRRVIGVRLLDDVAEVHVVARYPVPAAEVARQVWAMTAPAVGGRRVDVVIADVLLPEPGPGL